jgi:gliding motility-associated-like protein
VSIRVFHKFLTFLAALLGLLTALPLTAQDNFIRRMGNLTPPGFAVSPYVSGDPEHGLLLSYVIRIIDSTYYNNHNKLYNVLVKMDVCGEVEWSKRIYIKSVVHHYPGSISCFTDEGDILLATVDGTLIKMNGQGQVLQVKQLDGLGLDFSTVNAYNNGKGFVLAGRFGIDKIATDGQYLGHRGYFQNARVTLQQGLMLTKDNGLICAQYDKIIKEDSTGKIEWIYDIVRTPPVKYSWGGGIMRMVEVDGGYVFADELSISNGAGYYIAGYYLFKMDPNGNVIWVSKTFKGQVRDLTVHQNGDLTAFTHFLGVNNTDSLCILRFNSKGEFVKAKTMRRELFNDDPIHINEALCISDYLYFTGKYYSVDSNKVDAFLIKLKHDLPNGNCLADYEPELMKAPPLAIQAVNEVDDLFISKTFDEAPWEIEGQELDITEFCSEDFFQTNVDINDTILCFGQPYHPEVPAVFKHYEWSTGSKSNSTVYTQAGEYWVEVGDDCHRKRITFQLDYYPDPHLNFSVDPKTGNIYTPFKFTSLTPGAVSVNWQLGSGETSSEERFEHYFPENGDFSVLYRISDAYGCYFEDETRVKVRYLSIFIPNTFTPNGDNRNDVFEPVGMGFTSYHMTIFNRWGELVFEGSNTPWVPQNEGQGVYVYKMSFVDYEGVPVKREGTVILMR